MLFNYRDLNNAVDNIKMKSNFISFFYHKYCLSLHFLTPQQKHLTLVCISISRNAVDNDYL